LEQWNGQEVLRQSRKSAWDRAFPGGLIGGDGDEPERFVLVLDRCIGVGGTGVFPIFFEPV
jgi:hypothetical protein